jgi:hypothetical protein
MTIRCFYAGKLVVQLWRKGPNKEVFMLSINPFDSRFLPTDSRVLINLLEKYEQYVVQDRLWEAKGIERAIEILYACKLTEAQDTKPTEWGSL